MDGEYRPIPIEQLDDGILPGYSAALGLSLRWQGGQLAFCDPDTGQPITTLAVERRRADAEHNRADNAEAELVAERARMRELEAELRRRHADNSA